MRDDWRPVPGFGNYQISRGGQVRSLTRNILLRQVQDKMGYRRVNLYRGGKPTHWLVHRIVASAFLGVIPAGYEVNHLDGDKANNRVDNLEIVTPEDNRRHAAQHGLLKVGEANPKAKLTDEEVRTIRKMRVAGVRVQEIAWRYDISERAVYALCRRQTWKHVD